jgi:hypothetical protein
MTAVEDTAVNAAETERVAADDGGRASRALFVSSALEAWATENPEWFARDVQINDTMYRRLDPEYYAWLRSRMVLAKRAATAGKLAAPAFEDLRVRFNAVHEWALEHFGEQRLLEAVRTMRAADYQTAGGRGRRPACPGAALARQ